MFVKGTLKIPDSKNVAGAMMGPGKIAKMMALKKIVQNAASFCQRGHSWVGVSKQAMEWGKQRTRQ